MSKKKHPLHFLMLAAGIFLMGTGIAIIIKSQTGTSPMSSLTNVMTYVYAPISLGTYTFFLNFAFFVGEFVLEPKSFHPVKLIQLIPTFFLSVAVDLNMMLVANLVPSSYPMQLLILAIGCIVFALSISLMVSANVLLMPGDAFIGILANRTGLKWGNAKSAVDVSLVILAVLVSLLFLHKVVGVREGTVIAAICIGQISKLVRPLTNALAALPEKKQISTAA